jgi:uncharacterized protein (DUF305 family)
VLEQRSKGQSLWIGIFMSVLVLGSAAAQDRHQHAPGQPGDGDAATQAYLAASERMHREMTVEFTGDPDVDFARAMIPHHQGAIDMAEAVLAHGQDPEIRALAEAVIAAQEKEIALLRRWLEQRPDQGG